MESGTMADGEEYSTDNLQRCSYRFLQQTAKTMGLPCNVKKVYLIQLIYTHKNRTREELNILVRQVRLERQQLALVRKKASRKNKHIQHQSTEISSTSNSKSPPITNTPKRVSHILIRYSPEMLSPTKYPRTAAARTCPVSNSDRVLRSFNRVKKPSYLLNNTTLLGLLKGTDSEERSETTRVNIVKEEKYRKFNRTYAGRRTDSWKNGGELVPVPRSVNIPAPVVARRERRLSGIYPLNFEDTKQPNVAVRKADGSLSKLNAIIQKPLSHHNYNYERETSGSRNRSLLCIDGAERPHIAPNINIPEKAQNLGYRAPNKSELAPKVGYRAQNRPEVEHNLGYRTSNIFDIAPNYSNAATNVIITDLDRPQNNFSCSSNSEEMNISYTYKENHDNDDYAVYYHKKIRAEQVRSLRSREPARCVENDYSLPKINEVFSKFNSVYCRDAMQPIYMQVGSEPEISSNPAYIPDPHVQDQDNSMLEKFYNLKSVLINQQPLIQTSTTTNTRTVYSTPIISTAKAQPSSTAVNNVINMASSSRDNQPYLMDDGIPRVHDFFRNFRCDDEVINGTLQVYEEVASQVHGFEKSRDASLVFTRSSSSAETSNSQDLGANVTIPEMVEDALEIISQDGDYMERMGMDIRMQCILCNWAGPKIILEYHIRKEHSADIIQCTSGEWCCSYTLGALAARRLWRSQLLEHRSELYVLSAKYEDPDCFMAALSTLSTDLDTSVTGNMTIYNKVTGEPYIWQGEIPQLPPTMPYDNNPNCLKLELSKMDILPNSANLMLLNRELVVHSPTKVVVGQPELDNINICLIVKIFA